LSGEKWCQRKGEISSNAFVVEVSTSPKLSGRRKIIEYREKKGKYGVERKETPRLS